eukprot:SAG31_NODE_2909_length_4921_cov_6.411240_5_plen_595_part_00
MCRRGARVGVAPPLATLCVSWQLLGLIEAWADIAGALTLNGTHHIWQGCPAAGGWHHAASEDFVRWADRGIHLRATNESWQGFTSDSSPCSGFVTVDDDGVPCAGFRQCTSTNGLRLLNPAAQAWDAPLELRCARDASLSNWSGPEYLFPVYFYRALPYDPVRPWKDGDGKWYVTIATDGCNATTRKDPCAAGGQLDLWASSALRGPDADWEHVGSMFTSNRTVLTAHGEHSIEAHEMVTPDYFGGLPGDESGRVRVITNNDASATAGSSTMYFIGRQANGSRFTDLQGGSSFSAPGATGMIDWGAFTIRRNRHGSGRGLDAIIGGQHRSLTMARTLGSTPNQVAVTGRRVIVGWIARGPGVPADSAQSLPQDLSLGPDLRLRQSFVPELLSLRERGAGRQLGGATANMLNFGQQIEVLAEVMPPPKGGRAGVVVLVDHSDIIGTPQGNGTSIGVDFDREIVYINATSQGNAAVRAGPLFGHTPGSPVRLHAIIDHTIVVAIFNNMTAITASAIPAAESSGGVRVFAPDAATRPVATVWKLATANPNMHAIASRAVGRSPTNIGGDSSVSLLGSQPTPKAWQVPKIHYIPPCLR